MNLRSAVQREGLRNKQNKRFKYDPCDYEFTLQADLKNPVRTHKRPFKCTVKCCGVAFKWKSGLQNHRKFKHSDVRPFKCKFPGCRHKSKTSSDLNHHKKFHSDERPFACPHPGCSYRAKVRSHMTRHVATVHCKSKTLGCSDYNFKTATKESLKSHIERRHSTRKNFKCSYQRCSETFKTPYELKYHFSNRHEEKKIKCDHRGCGRKYGNIKALNEHKLDVHSKRRHACTHLNCSYRTTTAKKLARHMIAHGRNKKISCSMKGCQYTGKNHRALQGHMRRHANLFTCPVSGCSRYGFTKKTLDDHAKFHSPKGRPFQCPLCCKYYPTMGDLKTHTFAHTHEKPFKCGHCGIYCYKRVQVKTHISSSHATIEFPFIVHLLDDLECLRCKVILPTAMIFVHSTSHATPVVILERLVTRSL